MGTALIRCDPRQRRLHSDWVTTGFYQIALQDRCCWHCEHDLIETGL